MLNITTESLDGKKPTIIVHNGLQNYGLKQRLSKIYRIRVIDSKEETAHIIFPSLSLAFYILDSRLLIVDEDKQEENVQNHDCIEGYMNLVDGNANLNSFSNHIMEFSSRFQRSFVIVLTDECSWTKLFEIQRKFILKFGTQDSPQFIPCMSTDDAIKCMVELSKIEKRRERLVPKIQEVTYLSHSIEQVGSSILASGFSGSVLGLHDNEIDLLLHGMGSIRNISNATALEIHHKTPFNLEISKHVSEFFMNDD